MNDLDMQDLFDVLRDLYPDTGDDRTLLTNLISEVKALRADVADMTTWREVDGDPPPVSTNVLFMGEYGSAWIGYMRDDIEAHCAEDGTTTIGVEFYEDGDLMDGDPPTWWCPIPRVGNAADEDEE